MVLFSFVFSSCKTFNGYYYDISDARSAEKFYTDSCYVFTKESEEVIVDFILKKDTIHVVEIEIINQEKSPKYKVKHSASFYMEEAVSQFEQSQTYNWRKSSKLSLKEFEWCIVSKEFDLENNKSSSFEFTYKDNSYCLCYREQETT